MRTATYPPTAARLIINADPGHLPALIEPDLHTGALRYQLAGARISGVIIAMPTSLPDAIDPTTTRLTLRYGDQHTDDPTRRPHRPVLDGAVTVTGAITVDAHQLAHAADLTAASVAINAPQDTGAYFAAVLSALARHWLGYSGRDALCQAAARAAHRQRIDGLKAKRADLDGLLDHHRGALARLSGSADSSPPRQPGDRASGAPVSPLWPPRRVFRPTRHA
ncbi:hypothetical protein GCM10010156_49410 [Planobispora rosea]|uniref:Uncharacterized protein n=1 Tax=Planobispora rosea TaxID=35762 RepID=A0A8J3S2F1_PLARO|nr:hypothetical protein [Planobispora rosea]GGS84914.1 hypothetical protein GCM10010156_49410 [Planobispora rosea]GIH86452.1 hypothetical protein Pro02_48600 [Planobispora rosea]